MTEQQRSEEPTNEGLTLERADGFEPVESLLPPDLCGHPLLMSVLDDVEWMGQPVELALCVLCGSAMVRWSTRDEDRSS